MSSIGAVSKALFSAADPTATATATATASATASPTANAIATATATGKVPATATGKVPATAKAMSPAEAKNLQQAKDAAQKFEAIFLRQMLSSLEKTNKIDGSKGSQGGGIYGSMVVNSLADSISRSGGVGLADVLVRALTGTHSTGAPKK